MTPGPDAVVRPDGLDTVARLMGLIVDEQARSAAHAAQVHAYEDQLRALVGHLDTPPPASAPSAPGGPGGPGAGAGLHDVALVPLEGSAAVQQWLDAALDGVRTQIRSFIPGGAQSAESLERSAPRNHSLLERGVALRGIFLTSATHDPGTRRYARAFTDAGAEYRTVASLPLRMLLFDDAAALLPLRLDDDSIGAVVVHDRTSLSALTSLFELSWARGVPFGQRTTGEDLTSQEAAVLRRLARGERDEAVARALGISERTLRRLVAGLMDRLGAQSRFQAGVLARKAGWL